MRAVVQDRYGDPEGLRVAEIDRPVPARDEVLVRVRAASVHPDVWHVVSGRPYLLRLMGSGVRRPSCPVPGTDLAGVVAAVGAGVTRFRPGDEVFGETLRGQAWRNGGSFAEYARAPESGLAGKPGGVSFAQAAAVPTAGYIALLNLPADRVAPGRRVLVNGAAGGVGAIVLQLAKAGGAHVTGVDHTGKQDLMRRLGADRVVDYTRDDFTRGTSRYDLIVDVPGNHPVSACRRALTPDGVYVLIGHDHFGRAGRRWLGSVPRFGRLMLMSLFVRQVRGGAGGLAKAEAMETLRAHLEAGHLAPVIDRTYPLDQAGAALRHLADGEPVGRIVLTA
ncbi:NAD(P)-dependent alcohol dehydrogenase [Jidongwangia harbinensis]|uniref:NAD(P)-dependent alcohol dehydrogenase n=1 Tax=Jidongwangia harbinensis TaxID=2878561 RepID=UPI001CD9A811|nr:NAD(P)-dependent alcohol dehydrogenase [Jidongwangia harbinensis]MCA2214385.1 NAD(P)-dependent alcohol dehydrogenase [Jidongwangia harbinensis]